MGRKVYEGKVFRLRGKLTEMLDGTKTLAEISKKLNMSEATISKFAKKHGLEYKSNRGLKDRNEKIVELIKQDLSYSEIGKMFDISKQRVGSIAIKYGIKGGWKKSTGYYAKLIKDIKDDINEGLLSYIDIKNKYNLDGNTLSRLRYHGLESLHKHYKNVRDSEILKEYKDKTAKNVLKSSNEKLKDPTKIVSENGIYKITSAKGYKKYPKIGNRNAGGSFEDRRVLRYIVDKRDNHSWTFKKIADKLNNLGYTTVSGVEFKSDLVNYKYRSYKKNKYKRLKY